MMRPIDADALKADLHFVVGNNKSNKIDVREVIERIDLMRTLDVKPAVHAHWIRTAIDYGNKGYIRCSNCGADFSLPVHKMQGLYQRYCGTCGAKMDGRRKMTRYEDMMQKMTVEEMARIIAGGPQPCLRCEWWKEGCGDKLCEDGVKKWLMEEKDIKAHSG